MSKDWERDVILFKFNFDLYINLYLIKWENGCNAILIKTYF